MTRHHLSSEELALAGNSRACTNCAKVKCKCLYRNEAGVCERCQRLNKACTPSPARPRGGRRHAGTRVARIEERLNEMVSILKTQTGSTPHGVDHANARSENEGSETDEPMFSPERPSLLLTTTTSGRPDEISNGDHFSNSISVTDTTPSTVVSYNDDPSPSEAEAMLRLFREKNIPLFPFIFIPEHVTSQQLRDLYPFLWLNIMSTVSRSSRRRAILGDQARTIGIQRIVVNREKGMDLLLGLITLVAWSHLRLGDRAYIALFTRLIATALSDLGLQKPEDTCTDSAPVCLIIKENGQVRIPAVRKRRTDEERRAILGSFVLNSMLSFGFKLSDGLRWSASFDESLTNLDQSSTLLQDRTLVAQVKMQLIISQIHHSGWATTGLEPPSFYLSAIRSQLHDINKGEETSNCVVRGLFHFVELLINDSAIRKPSTPWNEPNLKRFDMYQRCLLSIKAWLDIFFSVPLDSLADLPLTTFQNLIRVMTCLHRLSTVEDPAWDRTAAAGVLDLIPTCDKLLNLFESLRTLSATAAEEESDEYWSFSIRVLTALRKAWHEEVENSSQMVFASQTVGDFQNGMFGDFWMSDMFDASWE